MCVNRNILVASLALLFIFCKASYANRGEAVGELMVRLGKSLTSGGSKADALRAKSIRSEFLTEVKADHAEALKGLSSFYGSAGGEFSGPILNSARQIKLKADFKYMTASVVGSIEANIRMAQKAADEHRLYGIKIDEFARRWGKDKISRRSFDEDFKPVFRYLEGLKRQDTWPRDGIKNGYYSSSIRNLTYHSGNRKIKLFPYGISIALDNVDDAIRLKNVGSVSATEALIKVFDSKELLDVNSIHQMWFVAVKVFPNKIDWFLKDFVEVIFEKFAKTSYDFEVYRAAASLVKGLASHENPEIAQSIAKISEDIMKLGHIVNGKEIAKGSLDVISPFSVVKRSSMKLGIKLDIKYSDEWVENTSKMIGDAANTGNLSDLSAKFSNAFKRAREFGDQFVGDKNFARKVILGFKDAILKGGTVKDEKVTIYFRWILKDRKILSISNDEVARVIAEIIESKNLFHLMDDPEITRILDEVPEIMESIARIYKPSRNSAPLGWLWRAPTPPPF